MAYKLTPEQYKDAARQRVSDQNTAENTNSAVAAYARMLNSTRAFDNKNNQNEAVEQSQESSGGKSKNWFLRTLSTIAEPVLRVTEGAAKFVENALVDSVSGLVASGLDLVGLDNAAKEVQGFAAKDYVGEAFDWKPIESIYNSSYSNELGWFGDILQEGLYTVGNQAIPFALNFVPVAGPALSRTAFALNAYGASFESASQDGGSVLGSSAYGLISAGLETVIENFGGWKVGINEKKAIENAAKKVSRGPLRKILADSIAEGGEEVISGLFDNYIKAMTYKGDYSSVEAYFKNIATTDPATMEELLEQFAVGAISGGMMGGANIAVRKASATLNASETIQEINDLEEKGYNLNAIGKDATTMETEINKKEQKLVETVNKNLDKFKERAKDEKSISASIMAYMNENFAVDKNGNFTTSKNPFVKDENVSYGMRESVVKDALTDGDVVHTVHQGTFEGKAAQSKANIQKTVWNWNKTLQKRGSKLNVIFADMNDPKNYGYIKGNTVVINAAYMGKTVDFTVTENGTKVKYSVDAGMSTLLHEVFHFNEKTKAGQKLKETLVKYAKETALTEEIEKAYPDVSLERLSSEISARQLENLLFNERIINNLTADNSTLAKRILNKATRLLSALKGEKLAETKELERLLGKTVKLYNKAIAQKGKGKTISSKAVDKNGEIGYSKRTPYNQYNSLAMQWANANTTKVGDTKILYDQYAGTFKLIESTKVDEGYIELKSGTYEELEGVYNAGVAETEDYLLHENINGYEDVERGNSWDLLDADERRRNGRVGSVYQGESESDATRNNERSGQNRQTRTVSSDEVRHSRRITDSHGNVLTAEQVEFFKDSKAVGKDGRLAVLYHGTEGEFYTFDKLYRGNTTGTKDAKLGFFFTDNKDIAHEYAVTAYDNKIYNLRYQVANGDPDIISRLGDIDGYKDFPHLEGIEEYGELFEKGERFDHDIMEVYLNIKNPLEQDWEGKPYKKGAMLKVVMRALTERRDGVIIRNIDDSLDFDGTISDVFVVFEPNQIKSVTNKKPTLNDDIRYSRRITAAMTEQERYDALKDRILEDIPETKELPQSVVEKVTEISSWEDINQYFGSKKKGLIHRIAKEFGVFKEYKNQDIELEFKFSNRNYEESHDKQKKSFVAFAKMFSVFDAVVDNAIGIEVHNRNAEGYKQDDTLKNVYVLVSAFGDNGNIVPVKLEVKEFADKKNTLYVAIALESIEKRRVLTDKRSPKALPNNIHPSSSTVSIAELLRNVNPSDKDFYKYIPKMFFEKDGSGEIRHSRRVVNQEELKSSIDDTLEMMVVAGNFNAEEYDVSARGKTLAQKHLNNINGKIAKGKVSENNREVKALVNDIFDTAILTEMPEAYEESILTVERLKPYLHSIDLTTDSIKFDVQKRYEGKNGTNRAFALWSKEGGLAWDKAVQEIVERMPQIQKDTDAETLFNIFDTYENAVKDIKKARYRAKDFVQNADEVKHLMAKQLVSTLSESGTELVTKISADKLQAIITEERNAVRQTLRAVQENAKEITFDGQNVSEQVRTQLQGIVDAITQERANAYAREKAESVVRRLWKEVSATELQSIAKTSEYQEIAKYISERYVAGEKVSITALQDAQPAMVQGLKRAVSAVKRNSALVKNNANAAKTLRDFDSKKLENQLKELSLDDTHIKSFKLLKTNIKGLFKQSTDGKSLLLSYDEMLSSGALKNLIAAFDGYLVAENPVLQDMVDSGLFEGARAHLELFKEYIASLAGTQYSELSLAEKQEFNNGLTVFLSEIMQATKPETMIVANGEKVAAKKYRGKSLRAIDMMLQRDKDGNYKGAKRNYNSMFDKILRDSVRPYAVIATAENHAGALEALYGEVRNGEIKGELARIILEDNIYAFIDDKANKVGKRKYSTHLMKDEVTIEHSDGEFVVTKGELIGLYLTLTQEDGFRHADASNPMARGIYLDNKKKAVNYRNDVALKFTSENVAAMEKQLSETDLRFIETIREFFELAGEYKAEVDTELYGVARLLGADYYPLQTDESARDSKIGDKVSFYDALDPSGHLSINQSRTSGLKALRVRNVLDLTATYAKSIGLYYGVAIPIANMRLVYNSKGVYGESIKDVIAKRSSGAFDKYLDDLLLNIQGAIKVNDTFMERRRQHYAAFSIAANIKSPVKALSGLVSLCGKLKVKSFMKGLIKSGPWKMIKSGKADFSQMYEYCPATRIRYRDKQATLAAMNIERGAKVKNRIVDKLAILIELVDKYTVYVAWNSAKAEVGAVGANANDVELLKQAGKLLNETLDTIDRFEMSERNAYSRSADSWHRGLAMFTSSAQAQLTLLVYNMSKLSKLHHLQKQLPQIIQKTESEKKILEEGVIDAKKRLKKAEAAGDKDAIRQAAYALRKAQEQLNDKTMYIAELIQRKTTLPKDIKKTAFSVKKAIISISMSIITSALLSQLMANLMGEKDEEEWGEDFAFSVLDESIAGVFNMLPYIGRIYNMLEFDIGKFERKGYDMSFWVVDEWNMFKTAFDSFEQLMDGTGNKTPARVARDFLYAIGQWFGIPTRNLYNVINTALKEFDSVDYKWDNLFQKGNYGRDLKKAIDAGDTELADTIMHLMMKDVFGGSDTKVVKTVRSLYEQGYSNVIPKTVSSSITINGETYSMTSKQQKQFKAIYSQADEKIERLIGKQSFVNLSPKVQADSIKWIYDYYYQAAKYDFIGLEDDSKKALFGSLIDVETLAVAYSYCNSLEADTDRKGNVISGTRKAKVVKYLNSLKVSAAEKYMILGYLGYAPVNQNAKALITAFARKNGADKAEVTELLAACNIAA